MKPKYRFSQVNSQCGNVHNELLLLLICWKLTIGSLRTFVKVDEFISIIYDFCEKGTNLCVLKGINNKVQLAKRRAGSDRSAENFYHLENSTYFFFRNTVIKFFAFF